MLTATHRYGCWNRLDYVSEYLSGYGQLIQNYSYGAGCEFTKTDLGQRDKGCDGCLRMEVAPCAAPGA